MKLYIGSGEKQKEGYQSIDIYDFGTNIVHDMRNGYGFLKGEKVEEIIAENFLEHLTSDEAIKFLNDSWGVLKKTKGKMLIIVPSIHREAAYQFPHKSYYAKRTFEELEKATQYIYGIKNWHINRMIINDKGNIHCWLVPIERQASD